ncbi:MAG: thioredoxin-dependent thiol peroxidase [Phycisphaerales bacterium]|nr:thioredoxin-dependent thiol peroxidase [Phycisphaerales bacterium]
MATIEVGKKAPAFALHDGTGKERRLKDFLGRPVVLYFYPKDDTSGCTAEACQFRDAQPKFGKTTAVVLGVSPDDVESHRKFAAKHDLNFTLLADPPSSKGVPKVCDLYGVWQEKSMYGRKYMGVVRTTYLIDEAGKVARRWDKVKVPGHAEEVLEAVKEIRRGVPASAR